MWSLPDIQRLNANAVMERPTIERELRKGRIPFYDPYSDDPKGTVNCSNGTPGGFFMCRACGRLMIDHYTWERFGAEGICLPCHLRRVIADDNRWMDLTKPDAIEELTLDDLHLAPHALACDMDAAPYGPEFVANAEFDSADGHAISGAGLSGLKDALRRARVGGAKRALLILDTVWQFAVSIGVYVDAGKGEAT